MKWKDLFGIKKIVYLFDWTPVSVKAPRPRYEVYADVGRVLLGYEVEVTYLHHGTEVKLFATDDNRLGLVSPKRALRRAVAFHKETKAKINKHKRAQSNERQL